jgi:hypothetical protein
LFNTFYLIAYLKYDFASKKRVQNVPTSPLTLAHGKKEKLKREHKRAELLFFFMMNNFQCEKDKKKCFAYMLVNFLCTLLILLRNGCQIFKWLKNKWNSCRSLLQLIYSNYIFFSTGVPLDFFHLISTVFH